MRILIVNNSVIPVTLYGGTERVIWYLGKELAQKGHEVTFLVKKGSTCDFAKVIFMDESRKIGDQIPEDIDIVHFQFTPDDISEVRKPYLITIHGNTNGTNPMDRNTVFVSANHAARHGSESFVYNGLDWNDYSKPDLKQKRSYYHFLGNAAWRVKNVRGAIDIIKSTKNERLTVIGGYRLNINMGFRFTWSRRIKFLGLAGGALKDSTMNGSKGLVFPVLWHEPFGLAIIESLYFGCPVYSTPYGSLPELVRKDVGFLSAYKNELVDAIENGQFFAPKKCHEYAADNFNSGLMAESYILKYESVLNNNYLNKTNPRLIHTQKEKFLPFH
ncbi:MAG: glycosyltransferase [Saprospiraceae bacterium]|nr:glycosyltransferase [Saprospiraceae bacterium]